MRRGRIARGRRRALFRRGILILLLLALLAGAGFSLGPPVQALTDAEARAIAESLEDEKAKAKILAALDQGAAVEYTYDAEGRVTAYKLTLQTVSKYFRDLTEEEKETALNLLIADGTVPRYLSVNGTSYPLSTNRWYEHGIISYGDIAAVNNLVRVTNSPNYHSESGQWRYWGFDLNGGLYGNDNFPRDSDSGTPAHEKAWLTVAEIRGNSTATRYIGEFALNSRFSNADKTRTAQLFLKENSAWKRAGLDADYILEHFYFNAVVTDSGLTQGQFVGVHVNSYGIWYQNFSVEDAMPRFVVVAGYVERGKIAAPGAPPDPEEPLLPEEPLPEIPEDISATAVLELPAYTYEGHPTLAADNSRFEVDGEIWSASRIYAKKYAWNRFDIVQEDAGTVRKLTDLRRELRFHSSGDYDVKLQVTLSDGAKLYDTKPIEVRATPAVEALLGGTQKENRKQVLYLSVATHPDYPLTALRAEIHCPATGETVALEHHPEDSGRNAPDNTAGIKTRPIELTESSELFTQCRLAFLTKNPVETAYTYRVFVTDSRGHTDEALGSFTAAPDLPPEAAIEMESAFLRGAGSDTAAVEAADVSLTDGDQVARRWFAALLPAGTGPETEEGAAAIGEAAAGFDPDGGAAAGGAFVPASELPGFQDLSIETGQLHTVGFQKTGTGAFLVGLHVRDVWTEETLPEYITEADYKTGYTTAVAQVLNIAPKVSLEPVRYKSAGVLLLGADAGPTTPVAVEVDPETDPGANPEAEPGAEPETDPAGPALAAAAQLRSGRTLLQQALLENNIDGEITVLPLLPPAADIEDGEEQSPGRVFALREPFGYEGTWTFLAGGCYHIDEQNLYTIQASWPATGLHGHPEPPYTITAYNAATGVKRWNYTFDESIMTVNTAGTWNSPDSRFARDESGKYLFFRNGAGKTLVLSANEGAYRTILNFEVGDYNYTGENCIYSFRSDGIRRVDLRGGGVRQIYSGAVSGQGARLLEGKIHFVARKDGSLYRGVLHPVTEKLEWQLLPGAEGDAANTVYTLLGTDCDGRLIVHGIVSSGDCPVTVRAFSAGNELLFATGFSGSYTTAHQWRPVFDENGRCTYVAWVRQSHRSGSSKYHCYLYLYETETGRAYSQTITAKRYVTESRMVYAAQLGSRVYAASAGIYSYVLNYGYSGYLERAYTFVMDTKTGAFTYGTGGYGMDSVAEFGRQSDAYVAVHTDDNSTAQIQGSISSVLTWQQNSRQILSRYIGKYVDRGKDVSWVAVLDSSGAFAGVEPEDLPHFIDEGVYGVPVVVVADPDPEALAALLLSIREPEAPVESHSLLYKKGELVDYLIGYSDYEEDPSRQEFWQYIHTPFNDGPHPQAGALPVAGQLSLPEQEQARIEAAFAVAPVLSASIPRFDIDGKYTVRHWQQDDTSRGRTPDGFPAYDKLSNVESLTFYIEGGASAPWITEIETLPAPVKEGNDWSVKVGVDDLEKDILSLQTDIYKDKKLVFTQRTAGIEPGSDGSYPATIVSGIPTAEVGAYEVVCTVRDETGAGVDSLRFTVISEGKVTGAVSHTDNWDDNRKKYNVMKFGREYNEPVAFSSYAALSKPRPRYSNVFWSGEEFVLRAAVAGNPTSVQCQIVGTSYTATLTSTGTRNEEGETIYTGALWDSSMVNKWGRSAPEALSFRFTAAYPGAITKTHDAQVILDSETDYWQLHRLW